VGELGDDPELVAECRAAGIVFEHADIFDRDAQVMQRTARIVDECCRRVEPGLAHAFTAVAAVSVRHCPVFASAVGWSPTKTAWQRTMDIKILERCAAVTAVSEAVASELATAGLVRRPAIIRNGVPIPSPRRPSERIERVGVVAHLVERKGVDVLLRALALLPGGSFERLRVAGTGESLHQLQELAAGLTLPCPVDWCGQVSTDEFFETIDVLVVPSRSDALPLILLNGMAAGLPVVASCTGGIPEALAPDEGWLVAPGDPEAIAHALLDVRSNVQAAWARGTRAREHARRTFSSERMVTEYLKCYEAIVLGREPSMNVVPAERLQTEAAHT
jgi:glycosyltransferase involved in cell wall biosynthesis